MSRISLAKSFIILTLSCAVSCSTDTYSLLSGNAGQLSFGRSPEAGVYDNSTESPLLDLIESAQRSLDIEIYEMRDPTIQKALRKAAQERNVKIRIIVEPTPVASGCNFSEVDSFSASTKCESYAQNLDSLTSVGAKAVSLKAD